METERIPWLFAAITAGWFGWMAKRAGKSATLWAVGGGAFGLFTSTIVLGLGQARSIPFSGHEEAVHQAKWIAAAAVPIAIFGWWLTSSLHRHRAALLRKLNPDLGPGDPFPNLPKLGPQAPAKASQGKAQS
jgi:hypothetical protein